MRLRRKAKHQKRPDSKLLVTFAKERARAKERNLQNVRARPRVPSSVKGIAPHQRRRYRGKLEAPQPSAQPRHVLAQPKRLLRPERRMNKMRRSTISLAAFVLICFFLPWVQLSCVGMKDSLSEMAVTSSPFGSSVRQSARVVQVSCGR